MDDVSLVRDEATGRYNLAWDDEGDVVFDEAEEHAVASELVEHRARWWADDDGTHGSQLYTLRTMTRSTPSQAEAFAFEGLGALVKPGLISGATAAAARGPSGRLTVRVTWQTRRAGARSIVAG